MNTTTGRKYMLSASLVLAMLAFAAAGCRTGVSAAAHYQNAGQNPNQIQDQGPDPADANMAPVDGSQQAQQQGAVNDAQQQADQYNQSGQGAPIVRQVPGGSQANDAQSYSQDTQAYDPNADPNATQDSGQPLLEADQPPPELPTYDQPEAPEPDYLWTPGYWSWSPVGYYWVPGVWCAAPYQGALWTPGYWGFYNNRYRFNRGYWGLYIGFYGGVNYGYGYFGSGYRGGYWNGPHFYYNRSVTRVNVTRITNVYNRTIVVNNVTRVSYNGGRGGLVVRPRPAEVVAMRQPRIPPMTTQLRVQQDAAQNRAQFYNLNRGRPAIAVAARPIQADRGVQRPMPVRENRPAIQPGGQPGQGRPGFGQTNQPQIQPAGPAPDNPQVRPGFRPAQPNQEIRSQPGNPQIQPGLRPANPQEQPTPQPQVQPRPQTNGPQHNGQRPDFQRPDRQPRPQIQPTAQPTPAPAPPQAQPRPQPIYRPAPQTQPAGQPRPQQDARPAPQVQQQPRPQPENRPPPQPHPQESRPTPQPRTQERPAPAPHVEEKPH